MSKVNLPLKDLTKAAMKRSKLRPMPKLVDDADTWFSRYTRLRDSSYENGFWVGTCITCSKTGDVARIEEGKLKFSRGWDAGHFIGRGTKITRYEECNVNLQCSFRCNNMKSGEHEKYKIALNMKYGDGTYEGLEKLAHENPTYKLSRSELEQIIEDSKTQVTYYENNH